MTSTAHFTHEIRLLADDEIAIASGGCFPIFRSDGHGGVIITSPTLDRGTTIFGGSTGPTIPVNPFS